MKKFLCFLLIGLVFSCKTKKTVNEAVASKELAAIKVIQGHYENQKDFKTISIRANAKYKDDKQSQSVNADIRIKKDEIIWINVKLLGFPVAKALITPDKVSYYEKINGTYFEGDFRFLSNWLGTDLDFFKVQNLFLGNAVDDLTKQNYVVKIEDGLYKLSEKIKGKTEKEFSFEAANFLLKKEQINQVSENRSLEIVYPSHLKQEDVFMPDEINIKATQENQVSIDLFYKNITFNEDLNFSFSIPNGYSPINVE
ncbi:hypothetical protein SY27_10645 [Flavobacterium sp. 316]|uniref:DUF4292 domain-containing protein n=1 Tax=Flavobacterium sp. 316 TaxID=1603293 RepID=UPI0005E98DB9|nr:DUF4292 domain-containing protein [Flavobacterium sp. 316]KIX21206.1 hypothetical protein SY27_10645 [Flavobacterium sp. 316]